MPSKKSKKIAPDIKMNSNPLTRRRRNRSKSRSPSKNRKKTKEAMQKVKMLYNPVRDCGSIGGGKKKTRKKTRKQKKKSCGCNKSWFF